MRRMLLILLAVLLPLQFSWAGTAVYASGHAAAMLAATQGAEQEHHHHQQRPDAKAMTSAAADTKAAIDSDFGLCHLASIPFALTRPPSVHAARNVDVVPESAVKAFASISTPAPDRPQWPRLA